MQTIDSKALFDRPREGRIMRLSSFCPLKLITILSTIQDIWPMVRTLVQARISGYPGHDMIAGCMVVRTGLFDLFQEHLDLILEHLKQEEMPTNRLYAFGAELDAALRILTLWIQMTKEQGKQAIPLNLMAYCNYLEQLRKEKLKLQETIDPEFHKNSILIFDQDFRINQPNT